GSSVRSSRRRSAPEPDSGADPAVRGRERDQGASVRGRPDLGRDDRRHRRLPGRGDHRVLLAGRDLRVPARYQVDPAGRRRSEVVRRPPADLGHALSDRARADRRRAARPRLRGLPGGVRLAAGAPRHQAGARAPGRNPDHRARLLRADLHHTRAAPGHPRDRGPDLQRPVRGPRPRRADPAGRRHARRRLAARRARLAARGRVRARRLEAAGRAARGLPGCALGDSGRPGARRLARDRRDRRRARGRRRQRQPGNRSPRELPEHGCVHRPDRARRHRRPVGRVPDHLRRGHDPVRHDADPQRDLHPLRASLPAGLRM
ncbi:MAG: Phosphate transport system permease protein PstC, partial [uncultured Solirubrobacterales bacterium]